MEQLDDTMYEAVNCDICTKSIVTAKDGVVCSVCSSKYHECCAKTNDNMQTWSCATCAKSKQPSSVQAPPAPKSTTRSKNFSKGASRSSTTSSKAKALLQSLEEEMKVIKRQAEEKVRLLKESHEQELKFLKKKQEFLNDIASAKSNSSKRSALNVPEVNSKEKVDAWIQDDVQGLRAPGQVKDTGMQTEPTTTIRFSDPVVQSMEASIPMPNPLMNSTLNGSKEKVSKHPSDGFSSSMKHNITREEVAARHVVKELPTFDGNPRKWPRFITSFNRSTEVCGFNDLENLERLSTSLTGTAFLAVESSLTMEENVPRILETLEMLFGKPEFIITSLTDEMLKSSPPTEGNIDSIIRYSLEVENISTTMKIAKMSNHLWNPILLSEMTERLPNHLKMEWATYKFSHSEPSIEVFSSWLKHKAMVYSTILVKPPNFKSSSSNPKPRHSIHVHQASSVSDHKCLVCFKQCKQIEVCDHFKGLSLGEKWETVRKLQLCRICLTKHISKMCSKEQLCEVDGCQFRHHKLLHKPKPSEQLEVLQACHLHHNETKTYFKILPINLSNGSRTVTVYAMLDDGSSLTLIDSKTANELNISGVNQPLCLRWTSDVERRECNSKIVQLHISTCGSSKKSFLLNDVRTVDSLGLPLQSVDMDDLTNRYEHLKGIPVASFHDIRPSILIGLNHSKIMEVKKYRFGGDGEPAAAKTALGWCIFGTKRTEGSEVFHINPCECSENLDSKLNDMVKENYSLEAIGVSNPSSTLRSKDDTTALEILEKTTKLNGNRFEVGLLWKYDCSTLPHNLPMARRRHLCLEKRFRNEPDFLTIIDDQIKDYVNKGYAKKLTKEEADEKSWFLPIFIVCNPNKPGKVRLVWDAAAETAGVSLNKVLLKGPDLLASLPGVLLRFREHRIALTGDIKEMFHQIEIRAEDRRFQRFLWRTSAENEFDVYEMNVMTFGATCSPSCSQFVKNKNAERFKDQYSRAVRAIQQNHYVDDWLESVDCTEEAIKLAGEVKKIHSQGGFEIRNWISNDATVAHKLKEESNCEIKNMEICSTNEADKILGMFWRTSDELTS